MRKYIGKHVLELLALLVCISVPLPIYAMTSEEKELLDMLGADYTVDENGNFEAFTVDVSHSRFTAEQSQAFVQKYKNGMKVGGYEILMAQGAAGDSDTAIFDKSGNRVFWMSVDEVLGTSVMYFNVNGDFTALHYKRNSSALKQLKRRNSRKFLMGDIHKNKFSFPLHGPDYALCG